MKRKLFRGVGYEEGGGEELRQERKLIGNEEIRWGREQIGWYEGRGRAQDQAGR